MKRRIAITSVVIDEDQSFTLIELSQSCQTHAEQIVEMVEHGLLEPKGKKPANWRFSARDLKRSQKALRLQQDLSVNMPGTALALDLLDEIEQLKQQLQTLRRLTHD